MEEWVDFFCCSYTRECQKIWICKNINFKSAQHPPVFGIGGRFVYLPHSTTKRFLKNFKTKRIHPHTFFSSFITKICLFVQAHNLIKVILILKKKSRETSFCRLDFSITNKNSNYHLWKYSDIYGTAKTTQEPLLFAS